MFQSIHSWRAARTGGLYAVARVLATSSDGIHLRLYSNRYRDRPRQIDRSQLFSVPGPDMSDLALNATYPDDRPDPGAFAIGHIPLRVASFRAWRPKLIGVEKLEPDDLADYEAWRAARGAERTGRRLPASRG